MTHAEPKVGSTIDFSADGKHHRHLSIPHSRNASGWGGQGHKGPGGLAKCPAGKPPTNGL